MSKRDVERLVARKNSPRGESARVKLELWVSEETLAAFDKARDQDRHIDPSGDGGDLLARMAADYIAKRDGMRCTFVGPDGTRCSSTAFLEIDHRFPRALGGGNHIDNLRLLCRPHNARVAERLLGEPTIAWATS